MNKIFGVYCGNKAGQNLRVTGDKVQIIFHSDDKIERRGYLLNFTLVSPAAVSPDSVSSGKWDHKEAYEMRGVHEVYLHLRRSRPLLLRIFSAHAIQKARACHVIFQPESKTLHL